MAERVLMLALSPTMEEGLIVKWVKSEGQQVDLADVLCEIETDKATMEYESPVEGTLLKIIAGEGQSVPVGKLIAIIGNADEDISELLQTAPAQQTPPERTPPQEEPVQLEEPAEAQEPVAAQPQKPRSSPYARKLAAERGIDISKIQGTGPDGRITQADVEHHPAAPAQAAPAAETIPVTPKRKLIAQKLSQSKFTAPHYYLTLTAAVDTLMDARDRLNDQSPRKVSLNAFLMKLTAETLKKHPMLNSTWTGETITRHPTFDIALAVAQPDGLIAPVVRNCGKKGILQIDAELKGLVEKTQSGSLTAADYENSTFTISSLGTFGIEQFTAIINPPNSAILAVGQIKKTPLVTPTDRIEIHRCMKLTLSCDHRLIDGVGGAKFLHDLKETIECPLCAMY